MPIPKTAHFDPIGEESVLSAIEDMNRDRSIPTSPDAALRIAIVVEHFAPSAGGVEHVAWQVATELARVGVDVTVLTRLADPPVSDSDTRPGVQVQTLTVPTAWQPLRVLAFSRAARLAGRAGGFDVVHSFCRTRNQDLYRAGGGSHREYMRRTYPPAARLIRQVSPRHRVLQSIEEAVFRDPRQRIQCASRFVADSLISQHDVSPDRILLLPNAVDATRYGTEAALAAGARLRAKTDEKAERIWLFPASGWRRKGLDVLLESFAGLRDPGARLWIAGRDDPAPWRATIDQLGIGERVRFLGHRDDLEVVYGAVDAMVLPTRYDAFANVTLEAAASGLPIVTTRSNGAAEWLADGVIRLDDASDRDNPVRADALRRAMETVFEANRGEAIGAAGRKRARALDWPSHVAALRDEYQRIVDARRATLEPSPS